jgi:hypothetical protein
VTTFVATATQADDAGLRFRINSVHSSERHRIFRFDGTTLSTIEDAIVDITVRDEVFSRVHLSLSASNEANEIKTQFDGVFDFTTSDGDLLLRGEFDDAFLVSRTARRRDGGATFFRKDDDGDSSVRFTVGPAIRSISGCIAPENFRFHLWALRYEPETEKSIATEDDGGFPAFTAKGLFIGSTGVIPEANFATLMLMAIAGLRRFKYRIGLTRG